MHCRNEHIIPMHGLTHTCLLSVLFAVQQPEGSMGNEKFYDDVAKEMVSAQDLNAPTPQKPSATARDTAGAQMPQSAKGCCGPKAVVANYPGCMEGCAVCRNQQAANETSAWLISKGLPRDLEKHRWAPMRRRESVLCPMT
jgi:hypothetical protein